MSQIKSLSAQQLRSFCELAEFDFATTEDVPDFDGMIGQNRAIEALSFAMEMEKPGYNMYLMGPNGLGKHALLKRFLAEKSEEKNSAQDWLYVFNFDEPNKPKLINLPASQGKSFKKDMQSLLDSLDNTLLDLFNTKKNKENAEELLSVPFVKLTQKYASSKKVVRYLNEIQTDLLNTFIRFCDAKKTQLSNDDCIDAFNFQNYEVNFVVKQAAKKNPVVIEDNPTLQNLFGQVEYVSQMGSLVTDYNYIKVGSLHQANGGYLIVDADKLLQQQDVWQTFKRALKNHEIKIPTIDSISQNVCLASMQPEAMPLKIKIILVGSRSIYNQLVDHDEDFSELFKIEVDFSDTIECTKESLNQYAQVIAGLIRKNQLLHFEQAAVKRVIEYGMRQIEDTTQLSTHMHSVLELLIESDYWARKEKMTLVRDKDVVFAIDKQIYRADRSREQIYDEIKKGIILIDVAGEKVASVNGLFVIETGRLEFSQPARITANVRIGDGDIVDIEREVDLGGALHSKGILILASYLGSRYATSKPLSFTASLVFEQSYGQVDGDSATVGELCTLLSAIAKIPVKQSLAITGSADQHGNVQAIGGINEKIEGFFDVCKLKGFTGQQGVIMPASNIAHLILRDDVVEAIEKNQFVLYPIDTVDEAISLLTGLPAGFRNNEGEFPENSINYKVEQRLFELAELKHDEHHKDDDEHNNENKKTQ